VCKFSVAVNEKYANGEAKEHTEWFNVTVFDKQAEACGQYLAKGRQVYVEGRQRTSEYEKDGEKKFWTEVIADRVQFLGSKPASPPQGIGGVPREQTDFP
jgi:single-strand DNA-binding protein